MSFLLQSLFISVLIQCVFFTIAVTQKTDKVTDLSYGISFVTIAAYFYFLLPNATFSQTIIFLIILLWGIRIALFLFQRVLFLGKDARFDGIRENAKKFGQFWLLQALSIWIIMLPANLHLTTKPVVPFSIISLVGTVIALTGLIIETAADFQKSSFKKNPLNKGMWVNTGLWKYAQHPNYFGEMLVWWGIFIIGIPSLYGFGWLTIVSPLYISALLLFVTGIPTIRSSHEQKYGSNPKYHEYKQNTRLLIPLPKLKSH